MSWRRWIPRWHWGSKDGGPYSKVHMYGLEWKAVGSLLVLRFEPGSREAFHSHAFHAASLVLDGALVEAVQHFNRFECLTYRSGQLVFTARTRCHMVISVGRSWVLSLRGPWQDTWIDIDLSTGERHVLGHGRQRVH